MTDTDESLVTSEKTPKDWSLPKKLFHTIIPCFLAFEITFSTSVTVPATPYIATEFSASQTTATLALTLYTIGVGIGPLFLAPLSEVVGRRWLYVGTLAALLVFIGGAAAANTLPAFLVCRFLAGFFGSSGIAIGAGTVADIWTLGSKEAGFASLFFILGPFLGPTLGPLAGAYVLKSHANDWRWTQYIILLVGAPIWVGTLLMSETLGHGFRRHRIGNSENGDAPPPSVLSLMRVSLLRPFKMLLTEVITLLLTLYSAYAYGMVFAYFASASYVLPVYYGFDQRQTGLSFISVIIGYLLAGVMFGVFEKTTLAKIRARGDLVTPEHRLYSGMVGSIFLPASLFWYAWEAHQGGHWAAIVASGIPFGFGAFSLFLSSITYLVDVYQSRAAASAIAANGILRYVLGAVFPLFTRQMYLNLGVHWAGSLFAILSILLLPIPWWLFVYGGALRKKSRFLSGDSLD